MFSTNTKSEILLHTGIMNCSERYWGQVQLNLHIPWFYVEYLTIDDHNLEVCNILFFSDVESLIEFKNNDNYKIIDVNLVTPTSVNKSGQWLMEPLMKIYIGSHQPVHNKNHFMAFILRDNKRYIYPNSKLSANIDFDLRDFNLVFEIK